MSPNTPPHETDAAAAKEGGAPEGARDFIRQIVAKDDASGKWGGQVVTRFPPEPNGYLHIGHAKAIAMDFGIAAENGGRCHLRFDDTNPTKEEQEFVDGIKRDLRWLGYDWGEHEHYASDYFQQLYDYAVELVKAGKAYVCDLSAEEMREYRGTLTEPGRESPYRDRSVEENLDLLGRMAEGEFDEGERTLRAKIDMASPNINLRDPVMYRILHAHHHRTGDAWHIYPSYDWAHGQSDSIEGITHSICTLEFEDHRPLYDWFLEQLGIHHPQQIEFARVNISHTITSKRKLSRLVSEGAVSGWDDPRMPTIAGLRRRGVPPEAIRAFLDDIGLSKRERVVELARLEYWIRDELNQARPSPGCWRCCDPLKVVIENWPAEGKTVDHLEAINYWPHDESASEGSRPADLLAVSSTSNETDFHGRIRRARDSIVWRRSVGRCGCATATSSPAPRRSRTPKARSWNCAPRSTARPAAARRPTAARCAARSTGSRRPKPCRQRSGSTTRSSRSSTRATCPRAATCSTRSTPSR